MGVCMGWVDHGCSEGPPHLRVLMVAVPIQHISMPAAYLFICIADCRIATSQRRDGLMLCCVRDGDTRGINLRIPVSSRTASNHHG